MYEGVEWAEAVAYGVLKLKPEELYSLSPLELDKMVTAHEKAELARRWETAYWVSNILNVHLKKKVRTERLMQPFLPKKTSGMIAAERDKFFEEFGQKRKRLTD